MKLFSCLRKPNESSTSLSPSNALANDQNNRPQNSHQQQQQQEQSQHQQQQAHIHRQFAQPQPQISPNVGPGSFKSRPPSTNMTEFPQTVTDENRLQPVYRYQVCNAYKPIRPDEISVIVGDDVILDYTEFESSTNTIWAYVYCFRTTQCGFVPLRFLIHDQNHGNRLRRKLPRSTENSTDNQSSSVPNNHHQHHNNHDNLHHPLHQHSHNQSSSNRTRTMTGTMPTATVRSFYHMLDENGLNMSNGHTPCSPLFHPSRATSHQHQHNQVKPFNISHSLQGGSVRQSNCKYNNSRTPLCPQYCNLGSSECDMPYSIFEKRSHGLYVVLYNFVGREENDLEVKPGEYVEVLNLDDPDWFWVKRLDDGSEGFVPSKFMCNREKVISILSQDNLAEKQRAHMNSTSVVECKQSNLYINHDPADKL